MYEGFLQRGFSRENYSLKNSNQGYLAEEVSTLQDKICVTLCSIETKNEFFTSHKLNLLNQWMMICKHQVYIFMNCLKLIICIQGAVHILRNAFFTVF